MLEKIINICKNFLLKNNYFLLINEIIIEIPKKHNLINYKKKHKLYDFYFPFLINCLPKNSSIIDIGANVGDTLASVIKKNTDKKYYCFEADNFFFKYLQKNVSHIKKILYKKNINVNIYNFFIGNSRKAKCYRDGETTSSFIDSKNGTCSISLDHLTKIESIKNISLIKTDTDGYDYDVINSSIRTIKINKPIIFFEYQPLNYLGSKKYFDTLNLLKNFQYKNYIIFDNYGGLVSANATLNQLKDLTEYMFFQNFNKSTRTIYYFDIILFRESHKSAVKNSIKKYLFNAKK